MANAIITFKLMPESPETDCDAIAKKAEEIAKKSGAKGETKYQIKPLAFGLKEVLVLGMYEISDDSFDPIAEEMAKLEGVQSAEVAKMDLAMG